MGTDITCSQKPKNNSFLFLKKTTIILQFYYNESDLFSKLYVTVYDSILTYLKVLTYFFFVKNQIQTTFFCKKILRTFLPPPNNVMLCFSYFQKKKKQNIKSAAKSIISR